MQGRTLYIFLFVNDDKVRGYLISKLQSVLSLAAMNKIKATKLIYEKRNHSRAIQWL